VRCQWYSVRQWELATMTLVSVVTCDKEGSSFLIVKTLDHKSEYTL